MSTTTARFMSDTMDYAESIEEALGGGNRAFWEFGHLLWRPVGYVTYRLLHPLVGRMVGSDTQAGIVAVLMAWNWVAGLVGVLALRRFVSRLGVGPWCVMPIILAYLTTFGVLNYAHSGSSYVPGLACLLVALALLVDRVAMTPGTAVSAGIGLALAVGFWTPYVLVVPAALAFPLIWFGADRRRLWRVGLVTAAFALVLGSAELLAIQRLGIRDLAGLMSWIVESSHGIVNIRGVSRVAFGIPRSFLSMDKDGILFKRFLLKDPYNPVSLGDLVRLSLAKVAFFYAVLLASFVGLLRGKAGRRLLVLAIGAAIPVLGFAVNWQGGDIERYMPAYPLVFAAWALVLGGERPMRPIQAFVVLLVLVMGVTNLPALSRADAERGRAQVQHRLESILPSLGPEDRAYVIVIQDPLFQAKRDPLFPRGRALEVRPLIPLGYDEAPRWRESFVRDVWRVWDKGGRAWITKRVLSRRPEAEWDWVEGDDKSVRWSDLPSFFEAFEFGQDVGGEDGFAALESTPHNEQLVRRRLDPAAKTDVLRPSGTNADRRAPETTSGGVR